MLSSDGGSDELPYLLVDRDLSWTLTGRVPAEASEILAFTESCPAFDSLSCSEIRETGMYI